MIERRRERCRNCGERKDCWRIQRHGGGAYNRPGRMYDTWICADCALRLSESIRGYAMEKVNRFSAFTLSKIKAEIEGVEP